MAKSIVRKSPVIMEKEAHEIGIEAYVYFYPLISMDMTRRIVTNVPAGVRDGFGPMNAFHHFRAFPTSDFREVVRPNFDTLYSLAWLDLSKGPLVVSVPDTGGRYYLLPMLDLWSDVFAVPGKRTSGTKASQWAVVLRGWNGKLPEGMAPIEAPTTYVWIIGRTQTNGPADYSAVNKVQEGFIVTPLSQWGKKTVPQKFVADPSVDMKTPTLLQVDTMPASKYFGYGAELMKKNPPHITDWSQLERLKRIGIEVGRSFDFEKAPAEVQAGLKRAVAGGLKLMKDKLPTMARLVNGWQMNTDTIGVYGNYYLKRAIIAQIGLGANQPEDAVYPLCIQDANGLPLDGSGQYVLHFPKDKLPPVDAFWSLTMYDEQGFQVANPLNRFAIGDRDALHFNQDGSLDIYIQHRTPGAKKESNWLPAPPSGELSLTLRLYAPKATALDGRWVPPAVKKTSQQVGSRPAGLHIDGMGHMLDNNLQTMRTACREKK